MNIDRPNSSRDDNVAPIFGGGVNHEVVAQFEILLERAKAGQIIGFAGVSMHSDFTATQTMVGKVGGSIMLGQFDIAHHELLTMTIKARQGDG